MKTGRAPRTAGRPLFVPRRGWLQSERGCAPAESNDEVSEEAPHVSRIPEQLRDQSPGEGSRASRQAPPQARRGATVGARLPRAAEQERGKARSSTTGSTSASGSSTSTPSGGFRLDRPRRPARALPPLVRPLHPAPPRHRRRQDRRTRAGRSSTTATTCSGSASTAASCREPSSWRVISDISVRVRARHRRRHRPAATIQAALGSRSSRSPRSGRPWRPSALSTHRGLRRHAAGSSWAVPWRAWTPTS